MFQLILLHPEEFDVLVSTNLNGDYLSDAIAAEVGGIGIAPGANMGEQIAVFEATHGTAPALANKDQANPGSLLFSGVMMFRYLGWGKVADVITEAYKRTLAQKIVTGDVAQQMSDAIEVSTSGFADALIREIEQGIDIDALRRQRHERIQAERQAREAEHMQKPKEKMQESGRAPFTVGDIMARHLIHALPSATVNEAMRLMRAHDISGILVAPEDHADWRIMTQKDVMKKVIHANLSPSVTQVRDIATPLIGMVPEDTSLHECVAFMMEHNVRRIIVGKRGVPIGIVTDTDIFRTVEEFGWVPPE